MIAGFDLVPVRDSLSHSIIVPKCRIAVEITDWAEPPISWMAATWEDNSMALDFKKGIKMEA